MTATEKTPGGGPSARYRRGVGIVVVNGQGLIFAGCRHDTAGAWQMPQGGLDKGEQPRRAALRELAEETGIGAASVTLLAETPGWLRYDLPPEIAARIWGGNYRGQEQRWFLFRFTGDDREIDIGGAHSEFAEWRWMRAADLLAAIVPFKRAIYDRVVAAFQRYLA